MIPKRERLENQLLKAIYTTRDNPTEYRINFDDVLKTFISFDYNLPNRQFEDIVEDILNKKLVGMPVHNATKFAIVKIMIDIAEQINVTKEELAYTMYKLKNS